ncbi:GDSL-type esterase/lipase family protein [Mucilaginibacter daejeonensis]|uniref:GDSL-type esterase/lipase family protein n=1 Tax=Mucilaginibacter daejeonensis TaxID=398049 RepID=UPI001D179EA1|nr:GDSL-type esterase/lipase family protein [Mucilaginibacter daejeonensis]UEG54742.1 GDSL-type esterase/lipase family protein [Mucilaginibacter daejeonensis]
MKRPYLIALMAAVVFCSFIAKEKPKLDLIFIGDSITQGNRVPGDTPPDHTAKYLRATDKFSRVRVANCGVSGRTTYNFLPGTDLYKKVKAAADTMYTDAQSTLVFSVMIGTNDSAIKGPKGAPVAPQQYRTNVKTIADSLLERYPRARIVLNYPIWYSDNTHNTSLYMKEGQDRVNLYKLQIDTLVSIYKKANPHHVYKGDTQAYDYFKQNYLTDLKPETGGDGTFYLHPNHKGDLVLAEYWGKAILKAIK